MTKISLPRPSKKAVYLAVQITATVVTLVVVNVLLEKAADKIEL